MIALFFDRLQSVAKIFLSAAREKAVKVLAHHDADGICAASIFARMCIEEGINFELRAIRQLTGSEIDRVDLKAKLLVLTDFGSGQLNLFKDLLENAHVLILDHHQPIHFSHPNLLHLNPTFDGIEELSASMVVYLFAKAVNPACSKLVDLAVVGAVGDFESGLVGEAAKIVEEAKAAGKIEVGRGLKLYGRYSRPIHRALEYSFDPYIPEISSSESNSVQLLSELGIKIKKDGEWRTLSDLSIEEQRKLASAIIVERLRWKENEAENIFGDNYTLLERPLEIRDAKEFATLINACGRMEREDLGIRICLGDLEAIGEAQAIFDEYRRLLAQYLEWIRSEDALKVSKNASYLFAGDRIKATLLSPVASILMNSNLAPRDKPLFSFANSDGEVKISARAANLKINLAEIVATAAAKVGGSGGGHRFAAGAAIPKGKENDFVKAVEEMISYGTKD